MESIYTAAPNLLAQGNTPAGSWALDHDTGLLLWTEATYALLEVDHREPASYDTFLDLTHPADRDRVHKAFAASVQNRTPYHVVHRILLPDGRVKWVVEDGNTAYHADGRPRLSIGTAREITHGVARVGNDFAARLCQFLSLTPDQQAGIKSLIDRLHIDNNPAPDNVVPICSE